MSELEVRLKRTVDELLAERDVLLEERRRLRAKVKMRRKPKDVPSLTRAQQAVLETVGDYIAENGFAPTVREIQAALGYGSPSTVHMHLNALEKAGYLTRLRSRVRTIRLGPRAA